MKNNVDGENTLKTNCSTNFKQEGFYELNKHKIVRISRDNKE